MSRLLAVLTSALAGMSFRRAGTMVARSVDADVRATREWLRSVVPRVFSVAVNVVLYALFIGLWLVVFTRGAVLSP